MEASEQLNHDYLALVDLLEARLSPDSAGIDLPPGWTYLLAPLVQELDQTCPGWTIQQVKEKFGSLRFYVTLPPVTEEFTEDEREWLRISIGVIESLTQNVCEQCGRPAPPGKSDGGWIKNLCPEHRETWNQRRQG